MGRVTIKKVPKGYQVRNFRKSSYGRGPTVMDDLGTYKKKAEAVRQARAARKFN